MKHCKTCQQLKPLTDFGPNKTAADKLKNYCRLCCNKMSRERYSKNPHEYDLARAAWELAHKEKFKFYTQKCREKRGKQFCLERDNAQRRIRYNADPAKVLAYNAARYRRTKQATPPWVDLAQIEEIYAKRPKGLTVDHIVPLKGIDPVTRKHFVSGLNVPWNLQYLTLSENGKKQNKVDRKELELLDKKLKG